MAKRIDRRKRKGDRHKPGYIDAYNRERYEQVLIRLPAGSREKIDTQGMSMAHHCQRLLSREHGIAYKWQTDRQGVRCPCCQTLYRYDSYRQPIEWQFCPSCGCMISGEDIQAGE